MWDAVVQQRTTVAPIQVSGVRCLMSARAQAGEQVSPQVPTLAQGADRHMVARGERPCTAWSVYRQAVEDGWGSTCRLCLILAVRWGIPVTAVVKLIGLLRGHA